MRGNTLDLVLIAVGLLFALSGYRQGLVVGVLSLVGFVGGGVLGAKSAPDLLESGPLSGLPDVGGVILSVFGLALLGQVLAAVVGARLRSRLLWRPLRQADALGGAVVSVVSMLLVVWLVGTAVASSPFTGAAAQVRRSEVIAAVDGVIPGGGKKFFDDFRDLLDKSGFPEVFGDLAPTREAPVDPPDPALARSAAVQKVRDEVLKVTGLARPCQKRVEGTGFVIAKERVMTNAHVVAGVREPEVEVDGFSMKATVVLYNPDRDIAVLRVPGLTLAPLTFTGPAAKGASGVVVGYPQDGPFRADAARVRGVQKARGPNIYDNKTVTREIYSLRARVRPGNSGGPLIDTQGRVLGVIFAAASDDPETGYALTAAEVAPDLRAGATATREVSSQRCD